MEVRKMKLKTFVLVKELEYCTKCNKCITQLVGYTCVNIGTVRAKNFTEAAHALGASIIGIKGNEARIKFTFKRMSQNKKWSMEKNLAVYIFTRYDGFNEIEMRIFFDRDTQKGPTYYSAQSGAISYKLLYLPEM
jgi:hypothetical protein